MWYIPVKDNILDKLIQSSPVPVSFVTKDKIGESFVGVRIGVYYRSSSWDMSKIKPHIDILESLSNHKKIATLVHEISHAKCHKKNCECHTSPDKSKGEIHAYEYTLKWLLKKKLKKTLKIEMKGITELSGRDDCYGTMAKHIMHLELWRECLKYVGKL